MAEPTKVLKAFGMKASLEDNIMKGGPSMMGVMDRGGDVIFPGSFAKVCDGFLRDGLVCDSHDWSKSLAMPFVCEERGNVLYSEAKFHSTQDAQDARTKAQERLEMGLSVGLSIGFTMFPSGYKHFKSGQELLNHAKAQGCDMSLFDQDSIRAWKGTCRGIFEIAELYEYSIVGVPMNQYATATSVKALGEYGSAMDGAAESATLAALGRIWDRFYWALWECVYYDCTIDEAKAYINDQMAECGELIMLFLGALYPVMDEEAAPDDETEDMSLALRALKEIRDSFPIQLSPDAKTHEKTDIRSIERILRDAKIPRTKSKALLAGGYKAAFPDQCDAGESADNTLTDAAEAQSRATKALELRTRLLTIEQDALLLQG